MQGFVTFIWLLSLLSLTICFNGAIKPRRAPSPATPSSPRKVPVYVHMWEDLPRGLQAKYASGLKYFLEVWWGLGAEGPMIWGSGLASFDRPFIFFRLWPNLKIPNVHNLESDSSRQQVNPRTRSMNPPCCKQCKPQSINKLTNRAGSSMAQAWLNARF